MKYISINQLKTKKQTPQRIIEQAISIDTTDHMATIKEISTVLEDLERLSEGLLLKDEEIKRELLKKPYAKLTDEFEDFKNQFDKVKLCDTAAIKIILEKHKEIEEMKLLNKLTNIFIEIENSGKSTILDKMVCKFEDWKMLSTILAATKNLELNDDIGAIIKNMEKHYKDKIVSQFTESYENNEKIEMKKCYEAAYLLDKGNLIIKSFINTLDIHENENMSIKSDFTVFEIEAFNEENLLFVKYINKIRLAYENQINEYVSIFFDYDIVIEKITKCIFEELIAEKLGETLNINNPIIFLVLLDICQGKIKDLIGSLRISYNTCEFDVIIDDLLDPYYSICTFKEKESINTFFEVLTKNKKHEISFKMRNEPIFNQETQPTIILSKLIYIFYLSTNRANNMNYEEEQINDLTHHFMKRVCEYVTFVCADYIKTDRVELIKTLSDIYLLMNKYFGKSIFFDDFKELVDSRIELLFQNKLEESQAKSKHIINKIGIKEIESGNNEHLRKLVDFVRRESKIAHLNFKGQNENTFLTKLLHFIYIRLYKKYLSFNYNQSAAKAFKNDIQIIYKLVRELNVIGLYDLYEYMYEISEVIHIRKEDIKLYIKAMYHKIPEVELKPILKCRADYEDVVKILDI